MASPFPGSRISCIIPKPMCGFAFLHLTGSEQCRLLVLQADLKLLRHLNLCYLLICIVLHLY